MAENNVYFIETRNINEICRICLEKCHGTLTSLHTSLDHTYSESIKIFEKIQICCDIVIRKEDGLPQQICDECLQSVNEAYNLREICRQNDAKLRSWSEASTVFQDYMCLIPNEVSNVEEIRTEDEYLGPTATENFSTKNDGGYSCATSPSLKISDEVSDVEEIKTEGEVRGWSSTRTSATDKDGGYNCVDCGKVFRTKGNLKAHMVTHSDFKPHLCSLCGKGFPHYASLANHVKIHGSKKFHCEICSISFHRLSHLKSHIETHKKEKSYSCSQCGRGFSKAWYLKDHLRIHSGDKPHACNCGRAFARKSSLVMHQRVHNGELPYSCPECYKGFSQRSQRKRHMLKMHKGRVKLDKNGKLLLQEHDRKRKLESEKEDLSEPVSSIEYFASRKPLDHD